MAPGDTTVGFSPNMKKTPASPADNLSPLGGAVLVSDAAESTADDLNLVVLRDLAEAVL
jgi:hypothetical protein